MEQLKHLLLLVTALVMLMGANVLLGAVVAGLKKNFDKEVLKDGIKKALAIALALVMVYIAGLCLPDIKLVEYKNEVLTIIDALDASFLAGIIVYAGKVFKNIFTLFTVKTSSASSPFESIPVETELME